MRLRYFALRVQSAGLIAVEVSAKTAAVLLDIGKPLFLGTSDDLSRLALRLRLPLATVTGEHRRRTTIAGRTSRGGYPQTSFPEVARVA